ncbi:MULTISPECIES: AMP-binding protein [Actinosynnema]|uniref:AMP-binding protein n=1 Tax=Actinosynnema TaxID=40566 RepID=UPI0020A30893|nr:AMP-binding protein [Actinosynnema pretiosum]MCP2092460.1 Acyl-CoA synthetase (AMP-forming)/AMP-acid ligase II [Actinosynnema pretiosum]
MPTRAFLTAFAATAATTPDAPALTWHDRELGYADLDALAHQAEPLLAGLPPGAPVCVPATKSPETIALLIACFRAGLRVLLPSPELGADALRRLCEQVGCPHVLTAADAPGGAPSAIATDLAPTTLPGPGLLLTTSGSTGTPKVVVLAEEGVDAFLAWAAAAFSIQPGTAVLNHAPLNFDLCLLDVWATLAAGGRVDLVDPAHAADGAHLAALCRDREPAVVQAVPLFFRQVTATGGTFPGVRDVLLTGDVTPAALLREIAEAFPSARLWNVYGCTETNDSFLHRIDPASTEPLPIGAPIAGVEVRVTDFDGRELTGPAEGELVVRTPFRALGYHDAALDRERWSDGWFRTGDLVRRDERGLLHLSGRTDHQVKVRGVRTNLAEVERVVLDHPDVLEAAVVAVPDELAGSVLRAVVRRAPDSRLNGLHLRVHCASALPRTAIPGAFDVGDAALPRTTTGKVDRRALLATGSTATKERT